MLVSRTKATWAQRIRNRARGKLVSALKKMCTSPLSCLACLPVYMPRMAETKREETIPAISPSDSGELPCQDPEIFRRENVEEEQGEKKEVKADTEGRAKAEEEEAGEAEAEGFRPSKRRKNCPAALEKSLSSNRGFSFSFDIKVAANGPIESTPKFGSFKHSGGIEIGLERAVGESQDEEGKKRVGEVESSGEEEKGI